MYAGIDSRIPSLWPTCQEYDEHRQQQREAEEMLRQTEEDADEEILQLKNKYEWQLRKRQEECTKMKGELGLQNKKVYTPRMSQLFYVPASRDYFTTLNLHKSQKEQRKNADYRLALQCNELRYTSCLSSSYAKSYLHIQSVSKFAVPLPSLPFPPIHTGEQSPGGDSAVEGEESAAGGGGEEERQRHILSQDRHRGTSQGDPGERRHHSGQGGTLYHMVYNSTGDGLMLQNLYQMLVQRYSCLQQIIIRRSKNTALSIYTPTYFLSARMKGTQYILLVSECKCASFFEISIFMYPL